MCDIEVIPNCQTLNISLPHSRCIEIVYGFAHNLNQIQSGIQQLYVSAQPLYDMGKS